MKNLKDVSDEALEAELARRKKAKDEAATPQPLASQLDFTRLVDMVRDHTKAIADGDEDAIARYDDFKYAVYEVAIECIYGRSYLARLHRRGL